MTQGLGGRSPANVQKFLKGADYPASKAELLNTAKNNHAPQEVLKTLEDLPADQFGGPQQVMKAYGRMA
ncbi:DUF2795 domain-containing protein [Paludibacterium paludis]|uniref:DUF2795 domain-containing protein n=1 Tax=Paludibacterium paludis TaxID=1225769 RepID=A0A918U7L1_9NEIS|nr:DUF2795 domain-containing protein [Paludibacterium paludis]GGY07800.1 hypothetical protein GCM10011289_07920 [Paludibacterium paludis]